MEHGDRRGPGSAGGVRQEVEVMWELYVYPLMREVGSVRRRRRPVVCVAWRQEGSWFCWGGRQEV